MLKPFSLFYKQIGIRRISDLLSVSTVDVEVMPQNSVLHYITQDPEIPEVDLSKPVFSTYTKKIHVRWITQYDNPTKEGFNVKPFNPVVVTNKWLSENRSRVLRDKPNTPLTSGKDVLNIFNYSYLDLAYRYIETPLTKYNRFINTYSTIFSIMAKSAKGSIDEHFLELHIGQELPSRTMLNMYVDKINTAFMAIFDADYKLLILEFWKWLDPNIRHTSILNVFDHETMPNIVFIFTNEQNKSTYLSLAYMNNWIKGQDILKDAGATQLPSETMQKVFLKFLISLVSTIEQEEQQELTSYDTEQVQTTNTDADQEYIDDEADDTQDKPSSAIVSNKGNILRQNTIKSVKEIDDEAVEVIDIDNQLKDLEEDLAIQEKKAKKEVQSKGLILSKSLDVQEVLVKPLSADEIKLKFLVKTDPVSVLRAKVEELGDRKDVSAADYRAMLKRIEQSQTVPNPYDSKVLIKDTEVVPADVVLDETKISIQATGANNIVDPSMSRSTLNSFTPDYVNKVLRKEIVSMVKSFTQSGVLIKNYEIEQEHSVLGSYEKHRIELQPLQGVTSPIHIRLPIVNENGEFTANGNKYSMRSQRVDTPIRKIEPSLVALTSYYGKTFVGLSERKAQSQIAWICTKLYQMSQTNPEVVKEVAPADVYYNYNKAPFLYNALAKNFRILKIDNLVLNFSYKDRQDPNSEFGKNGIPKEAGDSKYVCGYTTDSKPVAIDYENRFHVLDKGIWIQRGSIFKLLGVSENDAPMDHSSINVFSKPVPVSLVLAYRMGLHNLLVLLQSKYGLQYRFVEGKRLNGLEDNQYSIRFEDGFLVIDKSDRAADFIMAGLIEYEKETKKYPIKEFYHKHVYLNLLKSKGLSNMYLNEIDNLFDMFIDPITLRILQEMKEPETLEGLLIRATEMLKDYEHPDSQDFAYQRIRGYERFAGVMYNELAKSIRTYRSKTNKTRSKIDMSPFQVWQDIMKDPANKLVEDINPIQNVKHQEIVTYVGVGGRDKGTINKKSRAFHINDIGIISEATVDSSDVGINTYMSCDPKLASMYGVGIGQGNVASTNTLSSSAMLAPGSTLDD